MAPNAVANIGKSTSEHNKRISYTCLWVFLCACQIVYLKLSTVKLCDCITEDVRYDYMYAWCDMGNEEPAQVGEMTVTNFEIGKICFVLVTRFFRVKALEITWCMRHMV